MHPAGGGAGGERPGRGGAVSGSEGTGGVGHGGMHPGGLRPTGRPGRCGGSRRYRLPSGTARSADMQAARPTEITTYGRGKFLFSTAEVGNRS